MRALMLAILMAAVLPACATGDVATDNVAKGEADATAARVPLRGPDCLDPTTARNWHEVSSTEVLVDAGRRKYRLSLSHQCDFLGTGPTIVFVGDPISGRVCGNFSDAIVVSGGERCRIDHIELIDRDAWNAATNERSGEAAGAETH